MAESPRPARDPLPAIGLSAQDLLANGDGRLSEPQQKYLRQQRWLYLAGTLLFTFVLLALIGLLIYKLQVPAFASRGELFLTIPITLFWLWLLRRMPATLLNLNRDLRQGKIASLEGRVTCQWQNTIGIIQFPKYEVLVGDKAFSLPRAQFFQFTNQQEYQLVYAPNANIFLGATSLNISTASTLPPTPPPEPSTLLTPQEVKLLQLIADGLSNKEVAAALSLSVNTVKMYSSQIYRKLGVSRRTEAIAAARKQGIL
jgi:DNA-binding CsgD family transcriptional regulator